MNRIKKRRVKQENAATSSSSNRPPEEHDLAYFIHDRVELMHQVFSVLKSKELKSLAPECVRRLSIDDLQELCLEELLGISSKRLCAILDGAEPPSDTESSSQSPERLETISLDSISSDEEILSQGSNKKKKHKHKHGRKRRKKSRSKDGEGGESRASRAGLTVLELLELQARARAIRGQLHQEHAQVVAEPVPETRSSDNEVEIKEEPPEVVEISSDEGKPDVARLAAHAGTSTSHLNETPTNESGDSQTVTKRINDLIITVPQSKPTRKIKLKRQKPPEVIARDEELAKNNETVDANAKTDGNGKDHDKDEIVKAANTEVVNKSKKNKKKKKKVKDKEGSDQDEITLQLSDSEKMDLLEDLDAKNLDKVISSDSESFDSDDHDNSKSEKPVGTKDNIEMDCFSNKNEEKTTAKITDDDETKKMEVSNEAEIKTNVSNEDECCDKVQALPVTVNEVTDLGESVSNKDSNLNTDDKQVDDEYRHVESGEVAVINEKKNGDAQKSDGEISDRESSEVEASDVQLEVVCISDDENKKKKKKKEKKSKRDKNKPISSKENYEDCKYKDERRSNNVMKMSVEDVGDDDVYEILEISDDSSCYEVDGVSVLSKEPTTEEIEAFSARMDDIELEKVETVIPDVPAPTELSETCAIENVSWKDRYLGSKKVQRVLTTSNVLNAIRKKNKELKKKLEEAKKAEKIEKEKEVESSIASDNVAIVDDGSIEQYETLEGSSKYVDPVKEKEADEKDKEGEAEGKGDVMEIEPNVSVTNEMKKDAKMLMKMYKRLLKYNDMNKQKDPSKKKKKKQKKSKDKQKVAENAV